MTAGRTNFIPDVKVQKLENGKLVALDFASANVEIKVQANGTDTTDYTLTGNAFTFGSSIASGAAIHVDGIPSSIAVNPEVHFKNDTKVENWVAGSETWFTVYGMNMLVPTLKEGTEQSVAAVSSGYLTVLKNDGSQLFNFIFLMKGTPTATDWADGLDDEGKATVTIQGLNALHEAPDKAQSVRVAPGEDPTYAVIIQKFGEVVAYLGVYPKA